MDRFNVVHVRRQEPNEIDMSMSHWDVARLLFFALESLGFPTTLNVNRLSYDATNVLVGYERMPVKSLPAGTRYIPYQLEQLAAGGRPLTPDMIQVLQGAAEVWDYSDANVAALKEKGIQSVKVLPLGFHERLATIEPRVEDIDVLFYGSLNDRRQNILKPLWELCAQCSLVGVYGEERDAWIARSKVVINLHYYDSCVAEQVRVSFLLNNRKAVVTEEAAEDPLAAFCRVAPYEGLIDACLELVRDSAARERLKEKSWEGFRRRPMADNLKKLL